MDIDIFFPERGQSNKEALETCARCPVNRQCLEYKQRTETEYGIWGGQVAARSKRSHPPPNPRPTQEPAKMIPKTLSASSAQIYEECPARWKAEYIDRGRDMGNAAASLGTVCHSCAEVWVVDGHYQNPQNKAATMKAIYDKMYWLHFSDSSRYDEGLDLVQKWLRRQNWEGRTVISAEQKDFFDVPVQVSGGILSIKFNYIMDRMDELDSPDGELWIDVTDYKTLQMPVSAEQLKHKLQARCYALAAQIKFPKATRIWVNFDLWRHDSVGCVFTRMDNVATWNYLKALAQRIVDDDDPQEILGEGCRYCVRKSVCKELTSHISVGGILGVTDPVEAADKRRMFDAASRALAQLVEQLDKVILGHMQHNEITHYSTGAYDIDVAVSGRREIDAQRARLIIGDALMAERSKLTIAQVDDLLKGDLLTNEQKSSLRSLVTRQPGEPRVKITKVPTI